MPDTVSRKLKSLAALYVLNSLSPVEKKEFETALNRSKALQSYVEELSGTLTLSESALSYQVDEAELQGQRNLLMGRIQQLDKEQHQSLIGSILFKIIRENIFAIFKTRQPAWAVAAYVLLAFFIGRFAVTNTFNQFEPTSAGFTSSDIIELIQAGSLSDVSLEESDGGIIQLALETKDEVNVSGGYHDEAIQQILFFMLLNDSNPGKRLKAADLIKKIPSHDNKKLVLISSILTESNPGIRLRTLEQLTNYEPDKIILDACLKLLLEDSNEAVRMGALGILAKNPTENIIPALRVVSLMDQNEFIKNKAREILSNINELTYGEQIEGVQ